MVWPRGNDFIPPYVPLRICSDRRSVADRSGVEIRFWEFDQKSAMYHFPLFDRTRQAKWDEGRIGQNHDRILDESQSRAIRKSAFSEAH